MAADQNVTYEFFNRLLEAVPEFKAAHNDRWRRFFERNPTAGQIREFGQQLAREYGLEIGF